MSVIDRGPADVVLALALIHHLAITHNASFEAIARLFAAIGRSAIVEFIPDTDSQVREMTALRRDRHCSYTVSEFETAFGAHFRFDEVVSLVSSERRLYSMTRK